MSQAERIISKFGGMSQLARALGHKHVTTVQGWKARGFIPPRHHEDILKIGQHLEEPVVPADFLTVGDEQTRDPNLEAAAE